MSHLLIETQLDALSPCARGAPDNIVYTILPVLRSFYYNRESPGSGSDLFEVRIDDVVASVSAR